MCIRDRREAGGRQPAGCGAGGFPGAVGAGVARGGQHGAPQHRRRLPCGIPGVGSCARRVEDFVGGGDVLDVVQRADHAPVGVGQRGVVADVALRTEPEGPHLFQTPFAGMPRTSPNNTRAAGSGRTRPHSRAPSADGHRAAGIRSTAARRNSGRNTTCPRTRETPATCRENGRSCGVSLPGRYPHAAVPCAGMPRPRCDVPVRCASKPQNSGSRSNGYASMRRAC